MMIMGNREQDHAITMQWLHAHCTEKGGWTKRQLELLGMQWPPLAGWQRRVDGALISGVAAAEFEAIAKASREGAK